MIFTSYDFLIFFIIVFCAYWLIRRRAWQNALLLVASYVFYGWVHPWYATLLGLSTLIDYFLALRISVVRSGTPQKAGNHPAPQTPYVWLSLLLNLGVLAFFKYFNFFNQDLARVLSSLGLAADSLLVKMVLPVGLSFYTLKKLAYILDVSRGALEPTRDLTGFALFVSFFPQITAGPIDRAQKLLPQIQTDRVWNPQHFYAAWPLIVMGFFKKVVIADTVRTLVDRIFSLQEPTGLMMVVAGLGFMLQILADFTAYTDLARGIARLFGFETSENFNVPYLAISPTEFWNRWHITLSTWLRDYVFFPLRRALLRSRLPAWLVDVLPPLVTMTVSGIWHGAGWTYLAWGAFFGLLIASYQTLGLGGAWKPSSALGRFLAWLVMFAFLLFSFILFRSPSIAWTLRLFTAPFAGTQSQQAVSVVTLSMIAVYTLPLLIKHLLDRKLKPDAYPLALYYSIVTVIMFFYLNASSPDFVYFQF